MPVPSGSLSAYLTSVGVSVLRAGDFGLRGVDEAEARCPSVRRANSWVRRCLQLTPSAVTRYSTRINEPSRCSRQTEKRWPTPQLGRQALRLRRRRRKAVSAPRSAGACYSERRPLTIEGRRIRPRAVPRTHGCSSPADWSPAPPRPPAGRTGPPGAARPGDEDRPVMLGAHGDSPGEVAVVWSDGSTAPWPHVLSHSSRRAQSRMPSLPSHWTPRGAGCRSTPRPRRQPPELPAHAPPEGAVPQPHGRTRATRRSRGRGCHRRYETRPAVPSGPRP